MTHHRGHQKHDPATHAFAKGLGWFSIGLGLTEVLAPGMITRALGMEGRERLLVAYGMREIATGIGILSADDPTPWIWGRVAGDALDIGTLMATTECEPGDENISIALTALAGVTALDVLCAATLSSENKSYRQSLPDYSDRSGFRTSPDAVRGAARHVEGSEGFGTPDALRAYGGEAGRSTQGLGTTERGGGALH